MTLPVRVYDNIFDATSLENFKQEISQSNLNYTQEYPNRLLTTTDHTAWLINTFQSLLDEIQPYTEHSHIQQAFIGHELPECVFSIHRSHPAIAGVVHVSLEDHDMNSLICLTDSLEDPDDYLWGLGNYSAENYKFRENSAIVVKNVEPRYHWGFRLPVGPNTVKRGIWFYLGK